MNAAEAKIQSRFVKTLLDRSDELIKLKEDIEQLIKDSSDVDEQERLEVRLEHVILVIKASQKDVKKIQSESRLHVVQNS